MEVFIWYVAWSSLCIVDVKQFGNFSVPTESLNRRNEKVQDRNCGCNSKRNLLQERVYGNGNRAQKGSHLIQMC